MSNVNTIGLFWGKYSFLSNFFLCKFIWKGKEYKSVEHAYQALKLKWDIDRERVRNCETPSQAKKFGNTLELREDFNKYRINIMYRMVYEKFRQNPELRQKLFATGDKILVEGNTWHDTFWGCCHCISHRGKGDNYLGKILVRVRKRLLKEYGGR